MPFPWLQSKIVPEFAASLPERRKEMQRREVRERAALLMRLGRSRKEATATCRANLEWEFDGMAAPEVLGEIDALVEQVYTRGA
jgi:hypothetical protein